MWLGEGVKDGVGPITDAEQPFSCNWEQMKVRVLAFVLGHCLTTCPFLLAFSQGNSHLLVQVICTTQGEIQLFNVAF